MKKIILTGGGTAGHVTPNLALLPRLKEMNFEIRYIGSNTGMERQLVSEVGVYYYGISSGKLRRYFDIKNFTDPFRIIKGYFEARKILKDYRPDVIFSKGGFVTVPVVMAAHAYKIPVISHESDMTPGLANKIAMPFVNKICYTFPETAKYLGNKGVLTGSPLRSELFTGNKITALDMCGFTANKPVLLVTGGSLGSASVNKAVREALPSLLENFQVAHLCGKGKLDENLLNTPGYVQFEYIKEEMKDMLAMADIIISRAGANSICEIQALKKPNILIPLTTGASRGDQLLNAKSFERHGFSAVIQEKDMTTELLVSTVNDVYKKRGSYIKAMENSHPAGGVDKIASIIREAAY